MQSINPPVFLCNLIFTVYALMPKGVFLVCCISSNELKGVCQNSTEVWDAIPVYSHMCQKYVWFLWVHSYVARKWSNNCDYSMRKDQASNISFGVERHYVFGSRCTARQRPFPKPNPTTAPFIDNHSSSYFLLWSWIHFLP